jgi:hypothetical protein
MTIERFELMRPVLDRFTRRFTVLDYGAGIDLNVAPFIAKSYDCVVVAIEQDFAKFDQLEGLPRFIVLKKRMLGADILRLTSCEHFDVSLGLNILHHLTDDWHLAVTGLLTSMDTFIQVPSELDVKAPNNHISAAIRDNFRGAEVGYTAQFPGHPVRPLYSMHRSLPQLLDRTHVEAHQGSAETLINGSYDSSNAWFKRNDKGIKQWIPAMNLWNFCLMGGVWPTKQRVLGLLQSFPLPPTHHGDVAPWNFLIDGEQLFLVDGHEGWEFDDKEGLCKTIDMVDEKLTQAQGSDLLVGSMAG